MSNANQPTQRPAVEKCAEHGITYPEGAKCPRCELLKQLVADYARSRAHEKAIKVSDVRSALHDAHAKLSAAADVLEHLGASWTPENRDANHVAGSMIAAIATEVGLTADANALSQQLRQFDAQVARSIERISGSEHDRLERVAARNLAHAVWEHGDRLGFKVTTSDGGEAEAFLVRVAKAAGDAYFSRSAAHNVLVETGKERSQSRGSEKGNPNAKPLRRSPTRKRS